MWEALKNASTRVDNKKDCRVYKNASRANQVTYCQLCSPSTPNTKKKYASIYICVETVESGLLIIGERSFIYRSTYNGSDIDIGMLGHLQHRIRGGGIVEWRADCGRNNKKRVCVCELLYS